MISRRDRTGVRQPADADRSVARGVDALQEPAASPRRSPPPSSRISPRPTCAGAVARCGPPILSPQLDGARLLALSGALWWLTCVGLLALGPGIRRRTGQRPPGTSCGGVARRIPPGPRA